MIIRQVKLEDIEELAIIYKDLYDNICIGECWSTESATKLFKFYVEKQEDLFLVAEENEKVIGAVMSEVKPWFDGNRLTNTEIFVSRNYQRRGIASKLYREQWEKAKKLYNCQMIEICTFGKKEEFPQLWYRKIGFETNQELIIMNGNIEKVLKNLKEECKWN